MALRARLGAGALIGIAGLTLFAAHRFTIDPHSVGQPDRPDRQEFAVVGATQNLIDFGTTHDLSAIKTRKELFRQIEQAGLRMHFMVVLNRFHFPNGNTSEVPSILNPGRNDDHFQRDLGLLQFLAGKAPPEFRDKPEVVVITEELQNRMRGQKPERAWERLVDDLDLEHQPGD